MNKANLDLEMEMISEDNELIVAAKCKHEKQHVSTKLDQFKVSR